MQRLQDTIAVVAGASRNVGRGIALVLGGGGATVYVTGRSVRGREPTTWYGWGIIEETAEMVTTDVDGRQPPAFSVVDKHE